MDIKLLNYVKRKTYEIKKFYDGLYGSVDKEDIKKEIALIYEITKKDTRALYKVKENILLLDNTKYLDCIKGLHPLIENLFKLTVHFMREQDFNASVTKQRLKDGDSESYFNDEPFKRIEIKNLNTTYDYNEVISDMISSEIEKIIQITKNRYTRSFGDFNNKHEANKIISKEYNDSTKHIELFFTMKETIYENFDNYDILISALQNIAYELIQMSAVLRRAEAMSQKQHLEHQNSIFENVCFVIMDGIDSSVTNSIDKIIEGTDALNIAVAQNNKLKSLCKFKTYKQDEIQGFFLGNIEDFLNIVDSVFESKLKIAYSVKPLSEIEDCIRNVHDSVYNIPFNLYGEICNEARKNMDQKKYLVTGCRISEEFNELNLLNDEKVLDSIEFISSDELFKGNELNSEF